MKAVIMAGGKGTRLRPLTCSLPKPMVPVVNRPMMEHVVDLLVAHGHRDLACTLCYMPGAIQDHFGDGSAYNCSLRYSVEDSPLGTAGSVKALGDFLDSTFLVMSGDALTDINLSQAVDYHRERGAAATIVLTRVATPLEYGVVIIDDSGRITRFLEKPSWGQVFSDTVNTGIYILEPEVMEFVDASVEVDFSKNLFPYLLTHDYPIFGYVADGYWCDVGNLDQYRRTHQDILEGKARVTIGGELVDEGVWVASGVEIERGAEIRPPVVIGRDVRIESGATVGDYSVIGPSCAITEGAAVLRAVVWEGCYVGRNTQVRGAILASKVSVKPQAAVEEGAVVGSGCSIGERTHVRPGVKIWPDKVVESGTQVNTSMVWGAPWSKRLFGRLGVAGLANIEITPDFVATLGAAYGSCLSGPDAGGGVVAVSSDAHPVSRMTKTALISGLLSAGKSVADIGDGTTAIARFAVGSMGALGGVHVRVSPSDRNATLLEFLDSAGLNIDKATERKVENAFLTEDFRRASPDRVGGAVDVNGMVDQYHTALAGAVDGKAIRDRHFSLACWRQAEHTEMAARPLLEEFGCTLHYAGDSDPALATAEVADLVVKRGADLGFVLDSNAEGLALIDEKGACVSSDDVLSLVLLAALGSDARRTVAVPITAPETIERLAARMNGRIVRTQANPRSVLEKAIEARVQAGGATVPQFQPVLDGLFALLVLLEYLAHEGISLSAAVQAVPRSYMSKHVVDCPWQSKGRVMRRLIEETDSDEVQLIDGIKVYTDHGWTLILPDSEEPVFHVYSEAQSQEIAEEIAGLYVNRIAEAISDRGTSSGGA